MRNPEEVFAFFTIAAGSDVLAVRLLMENYYHIAIPLVFGAAILWSIFGYVLPWQVLMAIGMLAVLCWSAGAALYLAVALFVMLRIIHHGLTAQQFEPPYWVSMGALPIAVVAGVSIVDMASTPLVDAARVIIGGTVVIFWCFAAHPYAVVHGLSPWDVRRCLRGLGACECRNASPDLEYLLRLGPGQIASAESTAARDPYGPRTAG